MPPTFTNNFDNRLPLNNFNNGYFDQPPPPQQQQQQQQDFSQPSPRLALKQMHPSPSIYVPLKEQVHVQAHRLVFK